jgi:tRNA modification GTPase
VAFDTRDTIVAVATPPGRGGIGVVRLSGPDAHAIALALITHRGPLQPRHATLTKVRLTPDTPYVNTNTSEAAACTTDTRANGDSEAGSGFSRTHNDLADQAIATYFPSPASYTGDDVVELSAHGSPFVLRAIVRAAIDGGARAAEPGEFTLRSFPRRAITSSTPPPWRARSTASSRRPMRCSQVRRAAD